MKTMNKFWKYFLNFIVLILLVVVGIGIYYFLNTEDNLTSTKELSEVPQFNNYSHNDGNDLIVYINSPPNIKIIIRNIISILFFFIILSPYS